jgi:hypothetical protein
MTRLSSMMLPSSTQIPSTVSPAYSKIGDGICESKRLHKEDYPGQPGGCNAGRVVTRSPAFAPAALRRPQPRPGARAAAAEAHRTAQLSLRASVALALAPDRQTHLTSAAPALAELALVIAAAGARAASQIPLMAD